MKTKMILILLTLIVLVSSCKQPVISEIERLQERQDELLDLMLPIVIHQRDAYFSKDLEECIRLEYEYRPLRMEFDSLMVVTDSLFLKL